MLTLSVSPDALVICRFARETSVPEWAGDDIATGNFVSITRTSDELSIVCDEHDVPSDVKADRGWRALQVEGPLDLALTGILASLAQPLAKAQINIFAVSTFDTDYLLVTGYNLFRACEVLQQAGHTIELNG